MTVGQNKENLSRRLTKSTSLGVVFPEGGLAQARSVDSCRQWAKRPKRYR